jgi:hypothetical protein
MGPARRQGAVSAERIRADESLRKEIEANEGPSYVEASLAQGERGKADPEGYMKIAHEMFGGRFRRPRCWPGWGSAVPGRTAH